jgi:hypothetical protein
MRGAEKKRIMNFQEKIQLELCSPGKGSGLGSSLCVSFTVFIRDYGGLKGPGL